MTQSERIQNWVDEVNEFNLTAKWHEVNSSEMREHLSTTQLEAGRTFKCLQMTYNSTTMLRLRSDICFTRIVLVPATPKRTINVPDNRVDFDLWQFLLWEWTR